MCILARLFTRDAGNGPKRNKEKAAASTRRCEGQTQGQTPSGGEGDDDDAAAPAAEPKKWGDAELGEVMRNIQGAQRDRTSAAYATHIRKLEVSAHFGTWLLSIGRRTAGVGCIPSSPPPPQVRLAFPTAPPAAYPAAVVASRPPTPLLPHGPCPLRRKSANPTV
jgi:hypothetical protein